MTPTFTKIALFLSILVISGPAFGQAGPRIRENFDFDWMFLLNDSIEGMAKTYDASKWTAVQLPHDWSIHLPLAEKNGGSMGFMPGGMGWYRKAFRCPASFKGKRISIQFDGVYHQSDVYINGTHLGFHPYGYTGFEYDLTPYLRYDAENIILVKVDHSISPSSRWYSGSGIYRHVWLNVVDPVHVSTWGTYITTPVISDAMAIVDVKSRINNSSVKKRNVLVVNNILDSDGRRVATARTALVLKIGESTVVGQNIQLRNPALWDIERPYLYTMETMLEAEGKVLDRYTTSFGVRSIRFDADNGFFLNGKSVKLKGMNLHADAGILGTAVPDQSYLRKLQILKEYGCNAIRCAHNPPSPEFLDMCDSLGFVVIDEIFDKWKTTGWFFGYYTKYFDAWWQNDLDAMLLRDRNHPSIVLWSVGNETSEQGDTTGTGVAIAKMLRDHVQKTDPTRPVTVVIAPGDLSNRAYHRNGFAEVFDVVGYNYSEPMLAEYKKRNPKAIMFVAEAFPYYNGRRNFVRDYAPSNPWYVVAQNPFLFGQFVWSGVDYLGESSGFPSTGWPTGLFDVCMFEKPRAAFHRAVWNDAPMVRIAVADQSLDIDPGKDHWSWPHLAAHWNFPQYNGHIIEVQTTTNCDSVSLWVNEKWMGKRRTADYTNNTIVWHVPYAAGKIKAIGYNGLTESAHFELNTSGKPSQIFLNADRKHIRSDGQDLSHITVQMVDENGIPVPDADQMLRFEISGNGKIIGLENGDLRRVEPPKVDAVKTYFGKALAVVQSGKEQGDIMVKVSGDGLQTAIIQISTRLLKE